MAIFPSMAITEQGQLLYNKAQAGVALNFTEMKLGAGRLGDGQDPQTVSALIDYKFDVAISSITQNTELKVAVITGSRNNADVDEGTYICELGLFALDPDAGEILYAYSNAGDQGDYFAPTSKGAFTWSYQINAAVGNAASVTATLSSNAFDHAIAISDTSFAIITGITQKEINKSIDTAVAAHLAENMYFESVARMKAATGLAAGMFVITNGYYARGDGGGGKYLIVDNGALVDDGGSYHQIGISTLYAKLVFDKEVTLKQFGAKGDAATNPLNEDTAAIVNAIAAAESVYADSGCMFNVTSITIPKYVRLFSDGTAIIKNIGGGFLFDINYLYKTSTTPQIDNIYLLGNGSNYGIKVSRGNAWGASLYLSRFKMKDFTRNFLFESVFNVKAEHGYIYTNGLAGGGVVEFDIADGLNGTNGFSNACEFDHVYISPYNPAENTIPLIFKCKGVKNPLFKNCSFQQAEYLFDFSGGYNSDFKFVSNWFEAITYFQDTATFYPDRSNKFVLVSNLYNGQNADWNINTPESIKYNTDSITTLLQKLTESAINYPYQKYKVYDNNNANLKNVYELTSNGLFVYHNLNTWLNTIDGQDSISINFLTLNQYANICWKWEVFTQIIIDSDGSQLYDKRTIYTNTQTTHCNRFDPEQKYTGGAAATAVVTASMVNNTLTISCDKTVRNIVQRITGTPMGKWEKSLS